MGTQVNKILFWKEASIGVIPTSPKCYAMQVESYGLTGEQQTEDNVLIGSGRAANKKTYGIVDVAGDLGIIYSTDNMLLFLVHGVGATETTADATADSWAGTTAYAKGDLVNHSDGLHTLTCNVAGTSAASEPDLSAYTTINAGRGTQVTDDGTVTWIIMPKLYQHTGSRGDCLASAGLEIADKDGCSGGDPDYVRKRGLFLNTLSFAMTGDTKGVKSSIAFLGTAEDDSRHDDAYTEMSAQAGFTEQELVNDFYSYDDCTVKLNGVAATKTASVDFSINNNISVDNGVNDAKIENIGQVAISGTVVMVFNATQYAAAKNHTVQSLSFEFTKANGCAATITLPQFEMAKVDKKYNTGKSTILEIPFSAFDTGDVKSITYDVIGPIATY